MSTVTPASASTESAIPYRESAEVSGGDVAVAFGAAIGLLALALALALLARRLGWLQRFGVGPGSPRSPASGLRVEQALRISPRTTLFRIADGEQRYLLAESRDGVQWLAVPAQPAGQGDDDAR